MNDARAYAFLATVGIAVQTASAQRPPITAAAFAPDRAAVVAVSQMGIQIYGWPTLHRQRTIQAAAPNLHCIAFAPGAQQLAIGGGYPSERGVVQVFSWPEGQAIATYDDHLDSVRSLVWQDDATLVSASIDHEIKVWNMQTKQNPILTLRGHSRDVNAICLLQNGKTLVSAGADQSLRVWDLASGDLLRSLNQHTKPVYALAVRPGSEGLPMVASAAADRTIRFWQPTIGRMVRYVRLKSEPLNIAWTADGTRIVAACSDGHVRTIDPIDVKVTLDQDAMDGWVYAIAVHPQDQTVVVGGTNGQMRRMAGD